jgi:hypothetical protein
MALFWYALVQNGYCVRVQQADSVAVAGGLFSAFDEAVQLVSTDDVNEGDRRTAAGFINQARALELARKLGIDGPMLTRVVPNVAALPTPPPFPGMVLGIRSVAGVPGIAVAGANAWAVFRAETTASVLGPQIFRSNLADAGGFVPAAGTAYFVYVGCVKRDIVAKFVEFLVTAVGSGAQTAEVGLFAAPSPSKAPQSLVKLGADGVLDSLTTLGVKRNTTALNTAIPAGTELYAGLRVSMGGTQPTIRGLSIDLMQGFALQTVGAAALTTAGPFAGAIIGASVAAIAPNLSVTLV